MRYIGNKENIIDGINSILERYGVVGRSFCDFFSGTTNVARYYKRRGYRIVSSDMLYLSFCLQKAYIANNQHPNFEKLLASIGGGCETLFATPQDLVLNYLNSIDDVEGFIYENYTPEATAHLSQPRKYFTSENGRRIDAVRIKIEEWYSGRLIDENEYYILLASLIESVPFYANIAGVYAAFHKKWDPRAVKRLKLRPIEIIPSEEEHEVHYANSLSLCEKLSVDILYLDPPYNARQYAPNYHLLETIARYDNPTIRGVTGMRDYATQKSSFCNPHTALKDLDFVAKTANYRYLVLSYNSEGIMPHNKIMEILSKYGEVVFEQFEYARYKSNSNGTSSQQRKVDERLYILTKS